MKRKYFSKFIYIFLIQLLIYSTTTAGDFPLSKQSIKESELPESQILLSIKNTAFYKNINPNTCVPDYFNPSQNEEISGKSPWLAFGLSYLFPGLGQLYNGEYLKAILFPTFFCIGVGVMVYSAPGADFEGQKPASTVYAGMVLAGGSYLWSLIDAPVSANRINEERMTKKGMAIISLYKGKYILSINNGYRPNNFNLVLSINY